jgi:mannose-1-phosphate guanylyltransferase / phosphomannomutase
LKKLDAVVLAGGAGTRSLNPNFPKILQKVASNRSLLDLHLENLKGINPQRVIFVLGHLSDTVTKEILSVNQNDFEFEFSIIEEKAPAGTSNALLQGLEHCEQEDVLVVLGDTAIGVDYNLGYEKWKKSNREVGIYVHPNTHPLDSDTLMLDALGDVVELNRKGSFPHGDFPLKSVTGSAFLKKSRCLDNEVFKLADDYMECLFLSPSINSSICALVTSSYFADSGTPSRLERIRNDFKSGSFQRRSASQRSGIFLDRDGCLIPDMPEGRVGLDPSELEISVLKSIANANRKGIPVFIVTNQPAIAKGWISHSDVLHVQRAFESALLEFQGVIDDFRFCPHHPISGFRGEVGDLKITCNCRKPKPGMILELAQIHGISTKNSFVIGDSDSDLGLAIAVGAQGIKARHGTGEVALIIEHCIELVCADN